MTQFYKEAIIDSPVWIGAFSDKDQYRETSKSLFKFFSEGSIGKAYITDYVAIETINYLLRKEKFDTALLVFELFLKSSKIEIIYVDELMMHEIKPLFEKYRNLSLTDCSIIALMKEKNIKTLFSFDSGFDKIEGITRKENV
ncbi:type II toxin-antitoxin system VapC family toxin [Candidatus Woesearchaeota archaeon]|nr:type II toxin-antitoxin system VapC family toxin [Candidatus Woesearchaeota archaeon]